MNAYRKFLMKCAKATEGLAFDECLARLRTSNFPKENRFMPEPHYIEELWVVDGYEGGDCWDGEAEYFIGEGRAPENFVALEAILLVLCPTLTHTQHEALFASVVEKFSKSIDEYYGNHTNYEGRRVNLRNLYSYLVNQGLYTK
jgi:hypothetical protein